MYDIVLQSLSEVKLVCFLRALKALGLYILNFYVISWEESGRVRVLNTVRVGRIKLCFGFWWWWEIILELLLVGNMVRDIE